MSLKYIYENLEIEGMPIADAIVALQAWKDENPEAVHDYLSVGYDGESSFVEVHFQRPMTEKELEQHNAQVASHAQWQEERDRTEYERLKAKYEGN